MDLLYRWLPKSGVEKRMWLQHDSDFDAIRDDPRFQKLLQEAARPQNR
jgi:hypothetical protein